MDSEQYGCVHEKQRLALIQEIDELEEERIEMKTELEEIAQHLNNFKEFWESCQFHCMPNIVLEILVDKEFELKDDQNRLKDEIIDIAKEIENCARFLEEEKEEGEKDKCLCIKNF